MIDGIMASALDLVRKHIAYAEPIVFALGFAESTLILSMFVPSSALFLAIGGVHSAAGGSFVTVWLAASIGAFLGDIVTYAIGRAFGRDIGDMWPLKNHPEWYVAARGFVDRYGASSLILGKFTGAIRAFVPLVAATMHMRWQVFLPASFVSCLLWAGVFLAPGYGISLLF
ncbi:MAG: DedA family protein [Hyphomicrobiaceae bacterium]|nr:DedA family protein [Hyphomicrobiaceae bacterium]